VVGGRQLLSDQEPETRFRAFQDIGTDIFIMLAVALVALAYRMVLTRHA
jgi:hypothetical protein